MPGYRHCTNAKKPFDKTDQAFLDLLGDWKEGPPVPVTPKPGMNFTPRTYDELVAIGVVGIYTTAEALSRPAVKRRTGWDKPLLVLGKDMPPDAVHS